MRATALMAVVSRGFVEMAELLLANGANANVCGSQVSSLSTPFWSSVSTC